MSSNQVFKSLQLSKSSGVVNGSVVTASGTASATSTVSQEDADKIAKEIALSVSESALENNINVINQAVILASQNKSNGGNVSSIQTSLIGSVDTLIQTNPMKFSKFDTNAVYAINSYTQLNYILSTVNSEWIFNDLNMSDNILATLYPVKFNTITDNLNQNNTVYLNAIQINSEITYLTESIMLQMPDPSLGAFEVFNYTNPLVPFYLSNSLLTDSYFVYNGINYVCGPSSIFSNFQISNSNVGDRLIRIDTDASCTGMTVNGTDLMEIINVDGVYYLSAKQDIIYSETDPNSNIINIVLNVQNNQGNIFNRNYIITIVKPVLSLEDFIDPYAESTLNEEQLAILYDAIVNGKGITEISNAIFALSLVVSSVDDIIIQNFYILMSDFIDGSMNIYTYINDTDTGIFNYLGYVLMPPFVNQLYSLSSVSQFDELINGYKMVVSNINSLTSTGSVYGDGPHYYGVGMVSEDNTLSTVVDSMNLFLYPYLASIEKNMNVINRLDTSLALQSQLALTMNLLNAMVETNDVNNATADNANNELFYVNINIQYNNANDISY